MALLVSSLRLSQPNPPLGRDRCQPSRGRSLALSLLPSLHLPAHTARKALRLLGSGQGTPVQAAGDADQSCSLERVTETLRKEGKCTQRRRGERFVSSHLLICSLQRKI